MQSPNYQSNSPQASEMTDWLRRFEAGRPDHFLVERIIQHVHADALQIARAQHRRRGSPDGVAGASDLANSQLARIWQNPDVELRNVATTDDLRCVLHRMLLDRWIERRRRAAAAKRGGGKVIAASQLAQENSELEPQQNNRSGLSDAVVAADLAEVLDHFDAEGRTILQLLLEGHTQAEIGNRIGLSRDAVGRRIRQTIAPTLARLMQTEAEA